jgi:hypothetical protein
MFCEMCSSGSELEMGDTMTSINSMMILCDYYFIKEEIRLRMKKETSTGY